LNDLLNGLVMTGVVEFEKVCFTFMCDNVVVVVEFQYFVFTFSRKDHVTNVVFEERVMLNLSVCFNLV
jgi:hypothetical protein